MCAMSRGRPHGGLFCFSGGLSHGQFMAGLATPSQSLILRQWTTIFPVKSKTYRTQTRYLWVVATDLQYSMGRQCRSWVHA